LAYWDWLRESVASALAERSIGRPVAVRLFVAVVEDHGELTRAAGAGVEMAAAWFGLPLGRLHAQGSARDGQVSVVADCGGRTALVSAELRRPGARPEVRVLVVGERGTLTYDDEPGADGIRVDLRPPAAIETTRAIERALRGEAGR
jgi:hypothetical protein